MKAIKEYDFTNKEAHKLPGWFSNSEFEKLVRLIEKMMNNLNEINKSLSVFDERQMDTFFIKLLAKFWGIPANELVSQKLIDILILKTGLVKPSTLPTLYLICSLFFSSKNIYIHEDPTKVYVHYSDGQVLESTYLCDESGNFLVTDLVENIVLAIEDTRFNTFTLVTKSLAAGIEYEFISDNSVADTLVDEEDNNLVDNNGNNFIAIVHEESISRQFRIKNLLGQ